MQQFLMAPEHHNQQSEADRQGQEGEEHHLADLERDEPQAGGEQGPAEQVKSDVVVVQSQHFVAGGRAQQIGAE
jgi:hypothetical protein